jgi:hypothetical protein
VAPMATDVTRARQARTVGEWKAVIRAPKSGAFFRRGLDTHQSRADFEIIPKRSPNDDENSVAIMVDLSLPCEPLRPGSRLPGYGDGPTGSPQQASGRNFGTMEERQVLGLTNKGKWINYRAEHRLTSSAIASFRFPVSFSPYMPVERGRNRAETTPGFTPESRADVIVRITFTQYPVIYDSCSD